MAVAAEQRQIVRPIGWLFVAGASLGVLSLILPHSARADETALLPIIGAAYVGGVVLMSAGRFLPRWLVRSLVHGFVIGGIAMISLAVYFSGMPNSAYFVMYIWVVLFSAYFFPGTVAWGYFVLVSAAYGAVLAVHPEPGVDLLARWLITSTGLLVAGWVMSQLVLQRRNAERARRHLAELVEASNEPIIGTSIDGTIESWNRGAVALVGYTAEDAIGRPLSWLAQADRQEDVERLFESLRAGSEIADHEAVWLREGGHLLTVSLTVAPVADAGGRVVGASIVAHDITEQKHLEEVGERLLAESEARARTDPLTGVANRRAWDEELRRELARAGRHGWAVCVAMVDLDYFKSFNDDQGHLAGDELLKESAAVWRVVLREEDFIARYGGEEFCVLLPDCSTGDAVEIVERLRDATPMGQKCSAGVASWDGSESAAELLRRTDGALYSAKWAGRDRLVTA